VNPNAFHRNQWSDWLRVDDGRVAVRVPSRVKNVHFSISCRLTLVPFQPTLQRAPRTVSSGVKLQRRGTDRSQSTIAEVKRTRAYIQAAHNPKDTKGCLLGGKATGACRRPLTPLTIAEVKRTRAYIQAAHNPKDTRGCWLEGKVTGACKRTLINAEVKETRIYTQSAHNPKDTRGCLIGDKAIRGLQKTTHQCRGQEHVDLYIYSPIHLHGAVLS
jgi:hypothetical protein